MAQPGSLARWHWRKLSVLINKMKWESVYGESGLGYASSNISFNTGLYFSHCDSDLSRNSDQHFHFDAMYIMISWSQSEGEFKIPLVKSMRSTIPEPYILSCSLAMPRFSPLKRRQHQDYCEPHTCYFYHYSRYLVDVQCLIFISPQFFPYRSQFLHHFCGLPAQIRDA